jgi:hypothetical protein
VETTVRGVRDRKNQTATSSFLGKTERKRRIDQVRSDFDKMVDSKTGLTLKEWRAKYVNPTEKSPPPDSPPTPELYHADGLIPGVESDTTEEVLDFEMVERAPVSDNGPPVSD